jgi:hypothetical protein
VPEAASEELHALLAAELATPVSDAVRALADAIRARHETAATAVLFYGSCLRRGVVEGVFDYYLIVDDYRAAYRRPLLAWLNRALPPNVFYVEHDHRGERLRAKYAVFSARDFAARAAGGGPDARVWARFSQPARLVWSRDATAHAATVDAVDAATRTAVAQMLCWLPGDEPKQSVDVAALWTRGFRETYGSELRGEGGETIDSLYTTQAARFDHVARLALAGDPRVRLVDAAGSALVVESDPQWRARVRRDWSMQRRLAKGVTVLGLFKTSITFDDWVSYALWKIERHSGKPVELTERQRRHPLLFAWPVIFRLLRDRVLR